MKRCEIPQPRVIKNYNGSIGGVDHHDWLAGKYESTIRGKKWYFRLFTRLLDMSIVNTWILYRQIHGRNSLSLLEFRRNIALTYFKSSSKLLCSKLSNLVTIIPDVRYDKIGHLISKR